MIGTLLALLPAAVLLVLIYKADTADREPWDLVLKVFGLGVLSVVLIILVESMLDIVFVNLFGEGSMAYIVIGTLLGVALVEEFFKLCAATVFTWNSPKFSHVFDGVVYCAAAALGYAAIENVFYVFDAGSDFLYVAAIRGLVSVPSHMVDGIFMGIFIGFAKLSRYRGDRSKTVLYQVLALVVPICEHCIFDVLCSFETGAASVAFYLLVVVEYIIAFIVVLRFRGKHDIKIPIPDQQPLEPSAQAQQVIMPAQAAILAHGVALCPVCRSATYPDAKYCVRCGYDLRAKQRFCTNCGARLTEDAHFCMRCGSAVIGRTGV